MITLNRNKKTMYYGLHRDEVVVYQKDNDGEIVYTEVKGNKVPVIAGKKPSGYGDITKFRANIAQSGGDSRAIEYGIDTSQYSAVMVTALGYLPIDETSLIWEKEPKLDDDELADPKTADWKVVKVNRSINGCTYLLDKVTKNG